MSKEVGLKELLQELAEQRGFDFRGYKKTTLERRFRKRMFQLNMGSYADYAQFIRRTPDEVNELLNTILINVTEFFRDPPAWEVLRHDILPRILKQLKLGASFRAWSAGCASGEEAYSIAILLAEFFGPRILEFDIKIYATDIDEEELTIARRGEYPAEALRKIRPEWREKYFHGKGPLRVNRDIRRLVIFGRSNLGQDAPISHVNLLTCRNVLIYFDPELQEQILSRLHYALEPGGILFLGKSESQLTNSNQFRRLNSRWRIFQRITPLETRDVEDEDATFTTPREEANTNKVREELDALMLQQRYMMDTGRLGVMIIGPDDVIKQHNSAMLALYGLTPLNLVGKRLQDTDLFVRIPELAVQLRSTRLNNESSRMQSRLRAGSEERMLELTLRPVLDDRGESSGTLICCEDVTLQEKLQKTIEELQSTCEELQSANEELETTNEELQSTNEELETTNEELQSTNEELETTNEELQSLNEELETTIQELEERSKELDELNSVYTQTLEKIRLPVMLVAKDRRIQFWNSAALRLFGFRSKPPVEFQLEQLPVPEEFRNMVVRRHRAVLVKQKPILARKQDMGGRVGEVDVHFNVVTEEDHNTNVLITFEPQGTPKAVLEEAKDAERAKSK